MLNWLKNHWIAISSTTAIIAGVIGFFAGQFFPVYFQYAESQRAEIAQLIDGVAAKGVQIEDAIPPLMLVAGDQSPVNGTAVITLNDRMLELFQAIESVGTELPDSKNQGQVYVEAMLQLRDAASVVHDSQTARKFVEAASAFKHARTLYEQRLNQLEPTFIQSVMRSL